MPVQYEHACKAIAICTKINEAFQWSTKADALAAWAKVYHDDKIDREARLLKLHAFRRMGQLARELDRAHPVPVLKEEGVRDTHAQQSVAIGDLKPKVFNEITRRDRVPSPGTVVSIELKDCPEYERLKRALSVCRAICKYNSAKTMIKKMRPQQIARARILMIEIKEWMREFEEALKDEPG